jgi:transglutaminase-like putative cysteine protease
MRGDLRRFRPDLALLGASLVVAASLTRLLAGGMRGVALGPLLASAAVGSVVPAVLATRRVAVPIRVLSGTIAVTLVSLWTSAPRSTTYGLPTGRTWHALEAHLQAARPILVGFALPLRPTEGVLLLSSLLVGIVSVLASVLLHADDRTNRLYPGLALLCPFALLVFVTAESARPSVALPVALFVGFGAAAISASQPAPMGDPSKGHHEARLSSTTGLTAAIVIGAVLIALTFETGGGGATGTNPGGNTTAAVPPTGLSLTSSLVALEVHDANVVLFRAHSLFPTYWQVAVLNVLRNGEWTIDAGTASAIGGTGSSSATQTPYVLPPGVRQTFTARVDIDHLSSRLLPVPPSTLAVFGPVPSALTAVGAVSTRATQPGQAYGTIAAVPVNDPGALAGGAAVSSYPQAQVQSAVALPPLPSSIVSMARAATVGAQTPLGQAEALVDWFRSGRFKYSLTPPGVTPGTDPIVSFLTRTRVGTCEQFAGAFTVLARTLGLPTRLVVGFTAGRRTGPDEVTVRGDDAHAWPEVYLGPAAGWVSFEPTPQQLTGEVAPEGVVGPTGIETTVPPPGTSPPTVPEPSSPTTVLSTVPNSAAQSGGTIAPVPSASPGLGWLGWLLISLSLLVLAVFVIIALVRRRRWSPSGRSAVGVALLAEALVDRALAESGIGRPRWQPLSLFVEELAARSEESAHEDRLRSLLADAATVAVTVEHALYDFGPLTTESARSAYTAALRVQRELRDPDVSRLVSVSLEPTVDH